VHGDDKEDVASRLQNFFGLRALSSSAVKSNVIMAAASLRSCERNGAACDTIEPALFSPLMRCYAGRHAEGARP
jgi:hypothetical protein